MNRHYILVASRWINVDHIESISNSTVRCTSGTDYPLGTDQDAQGLIEAITESRASA
jgi:hypothetical protein